MNVRTLVLLFLAGTSLAAGDLDAFLSFGMLSPSKDLSNQAVNSLGQTTGQEFHPGDFTMAGLGTAYTFLSRGDFRFRGNLEFAQSVRNSGATLRYLEYQNTQTYYLEAEGTLKATSINLGVTAVYVSTGAGEYGVTLERRSQALEFDMSQVTKSFPGETSSLTDQRMKRTLTDPFLSVHATFVQHYESFGLFTRLAYGVNLSSSPAVGSFHQQQFQNLDPSLLETLRPLQEVKLSMGARF